MGRHGLEQMTAFRPTPEAPSEASTIGCEDAAAFYKAMYETEKDSGMERVVLVAYVCILLVAAFTVLCDAFRLIFRHRQHDSAPNPLRLFGAAIVIALLMTAAVGTIQAF